MAYIEIQTLIDITRTKVSRPNQGSQLELDQQRNFITLLQCAEMRSIVSYESSPETATTDITDMGFGTNYTGQHAVWTFRCSPDRDNVYMDQNNNPVGFLIDDVDGVPIITNLTETINIAKAIFDCSSVANKNTIIKAHPGTI